MTKMKYKLLNALLALSCFTVLVGQTAYAQESSESGGTTEGETACGTSCGEGGDGSSPTEDTDDGASDMDTGATGAGGTNPGEAGFDGYDYSPSSTSSYGGFQTGSVANSDFGGYANSYSGRSGYAGLSGYSDISGGLSDLGSGVSGYGDYSFARGNLSGVSYQNSSPVSDVNNLKPTNCSFRGDMQVSTKNGYADISAIRQGDYVFARNEITGQTNWQRVERLHKRNHAVTVSLTVVDDSGQSQTIVSNDKHAYFAQIGSANDYRQLNQSSEGHKYHGEQALGQWIDAQQLKAGYRLLGENGQWLIVKTVDVERQPLTAYNLTVAHDHTYFVKAPDGKQGVWVHNEGPCSGVAFASRPTPTFFQSQVGAVTLAAPIALAPVVASTVVGGYAVPTVSSAVAAFAVANPGTVTAVSGAAITTGAYINANRGGSTPAGIVTSVASGALLSGVNRVWNVASGLTPSLTAPLTNFGSASIKVVTSGLGYSVGLVRDRSAQGGGSWWTSPVSGWGQSSNVGATGGGKAAPFQGGWVGR